MHLFPPFLSFVLGLVTCLSVAQAQARPQSARAYAQDRELGIQYGFPTVDSMTNTHESFAEIISYYIFDPTAKDCLSPKIQAYVKSVLKED